VTMVRSVLLSFILAGTLIMEGKLGQELLRFSEASGEGEDEAARVSTAADLLRAPVLADLLRERAGDDGSDSASASASDCRAVRVGVADRETEAETGEGDDRDAGATADRLLSTAELEAEACTPFMPFIEPD